MQRASRNTGLGNVLDIPIRYYWAGCAESVPSGGAVGQFYSAAQHCSSVAMGNHRSSCAGFREFTYATLCLSRDNRGSLSGSGSLSLYGHLSTVTARCEPLSFNSGFSVSCKLVWIKTIWNAMKKMLKAISGGGIHEKLKIWPVSGVGEFLLSVK